MTDTDPAPDLDPHPGGDRTYYTEARVRASDLAEGDVVLVDRDWRDVLDVWTDANTTRAGALGNVPKEDRDFIQRHLNGLSMYVVVRYLVEQPGTSEVGYKYHVWRRCDLVTAQVPDPMFV